MKTFFVNPHNWRTGFVAEAPMTVWPVCTHRHPLATLPPLNVLTALPVTRSQAHIPHSWPDVSVVRSSCRNHQRGKKHLRQLKLNCISTLACILPPPPPKFLPLSMLNFLINQFNVTHQINCLYKKEWHIFLVHMLLLSTVLNQSYNIYFKYYISISV